MKPLEEAICILVLILFTTQKYSFNNNYLNKFITLKQTAYFGSVVTLRS